VSRERKRASALSLKSLTEKVTSVALSDEIEIDRNTLPKDGFTETKFLSLWNAYAEQLVQRGDKSLASILNASKPVLKEWNIQYALPNNLMADQLERLKPRLLKYLRESLNNFSIDLEVHVIETEVKKFIYTPQEKYSKLKEINPDVEILKNMFGLDL
jgi:DNA polymerase-3 subunit gamma/tau